MKWMSRLFLITLSGFFAALPVCSKAQLKAEILFSKSPEHEIEIPRFLELSVQEKSRADATAEIISWFSENAWLDARIDSVVTGTTSEKWHVNSGCRYLVESVQEIVHPDTLNFSDPLYETEIEGQFFTKENVEEYISQKLKQFEERGYLLAGIEVTKVKIRESSCSVNLDIEITAGERYSLSGILFTGAERNNPLFLEKVARVSNGSAITPRLMERARQNLLNSDLLVSAEEADLVFQDEKAFLRFRVEEQQLNFFDGIIGFVPDEDGTAQIVGNADLRLRNMITDGTNLQIKFEQLRPLVTKLFIEGEQQFIAGLPLRASASLHFTQQDSAYLERNFRFETGFMILPGFELLGSIRAETSSVSNQVRREAVNLDSRATFLGFGFRLRNVDRLLVPTTGYQFRALLESGRRFITDDRLDETKEDNFSQTILTTEGRVYFKIGSRQVLTPGFEGYFIDSPSFIITDLHRFGGTESIRGFREDQFRASGVLWSDLEFRQLLSPDSYIFGFGSYGRFKRPQLINEDTDQFELTDSIQSFGFGVAFQTALGFLKVSYAISTEDQLSNGKVHVGISAGL